MQRIPMVHQDEAAECGLACLAMVAGAYGGDTRLRVLRARHGQAARGSSLTRLMATARAIGLEGRAIRVDPEELRQVQLPCILHWNLDHFVVLAGITRSGYVIHDPAIGRRRVLKEELARSFTGVALELEPTGTLSAPPKSSAPSLLTLWKGSIPLTARLALILALSFVVELGIFCVPAYLQVALDHVVGSGDLAFLHIAGLSLLAILMATAFVDGVREWTIVLMRTHLGFLASSRLFDKAISLPLPHFEARNVADTQSRFRSLETIHSAMSSSAILLGMDAIVSVIGLGVTAYYSVTLAVITVLALAAYATLRAGLVGRTLLAQQEMIASNVRRESYLVDCTRNIQVIKIFGQEPVSSARYRNEAATAARAQQRVDRLTVVFHALSSVITQGAAVATVWVGALLVVDRHLTAGMLMAALLLRTTLFNRGAAVVNTLMDFRLLRLQAERVADICDTESEPGEALVPDLGCSDVRIEHLVFAYGAAEAPLFEDFSLNVPQGQCVVLTGPSGSGKSTLLKLILGLVRPREGRILVGGVDVSSNPRALRGQVTAVMQDDALFPGSIVENVSMFDPRPDMDWLSHCLRMTCCADFVSRMSLGVHTPLSSSGGGISGGQRQRLLLARALYQRPKLLLLDEATSHLDIETERTIVRNLREIGITTIHAAHRQESIHHADRAIHIDGPLRGETRMKPDRVSA